MDKSIWYEECDKGWLNLIPSIITCEYEEDVFTPINTIIHLPEQDLEDFHLYPRCSVQAIDEEFSKNRYESRVGDIVSQNGTKVIVQEQSQPYYLYYQINFFAQFKSDIDRISKLWRAFNGRSFNLPITLSDGTPHKCAVDFVKFNNQDDIEREVRRYIRSYIYKVWVDLEGGTYEADVVTGLNHKKI